MLLNLLDRCLRVANEVLSAIAQTPKVIWLMFFNGLPEPKSFVPLIKQRLIFPQSGTIIEISAIPGERALRSLEGVIEASLSDC